jgi:hypothetical protein
MLQRDSKENINFFRILHLPTFRNVSMKSSIIRVLAVSLTVAAAIAIPATVKAQSDSLSDRASEAASRQGLISTESNYCFWVPGYGKRCW